MYSMKKHQQSQLFTRQTILLGFLVLVGIQISIVTLLSFKIDDVKYESLETEYNENLDEICRDDPQNENCINQSRNFAHGRVSSSRQTQSLSSFDNAIDPNLKPMKFSLEEGGMERTFMAYVTPDISTFYKSKGMKKKKKNPNFSGLAGKFINMSPEPLRLYWGSAGSGMYIADAGSFEAVGTATFPGHKFYFASEQNPNDVKCHMTVVDHKSVYIYDPFVSGELPISMLQGDEKRRYDLQRQNLNFGDAYKQFTGRDWLALYPLRKRPIHNMWNADYFGQQHWVQSSQTHFVKEPPAELLHPIKDKQMYKMSKSNELPSLLEYRSPEQTLNMTMTVISCAPRAFEIKNFLSHAEVDHIVHMATGMKLSLSTTSGSEGGSRRSDSKTRTSYNSWVPRTRSPIIDAVYRRAADLMQIDEALLRHRHADERPDLNFKYTSSEDLQLVHYEHGQQYTAHHDFGYPMSSREHQPARFATLLLYLNEGMLGGETSFPRWMNADTKDELLVTPEVGKAVLFYSLLPDGNMDDFSQHAAKPVHQGEKWLINLWTWDPMFR